ncbi:MAG: hypothetical protein GX455_02015 [Phycisphaerae bacterium]|nr:hypothetical protein [Phycisphaerae bacterium]
MMVKMQLGGLFGDPTLANVKVDGTFGGFGVKMADEDVMFAVLVPVADFDKFVSGNANIGKPDDKGVYPITQGQGQTEASAMFVRAGSYIAITAPDMGEALVGLMAKKSSNLAGILDVPTLTTATKEPLWAYLNVKQVNTAFGEDIQNGFKEMSEGMAGTGMMNATSAKAVEMMMQMVHSAMEQSDWLSLSLRPSKDFLTASLKIQAVAGSDMAGFLTAAPAGRLPVELIEDGAMMSAAAKFNRDAWAKANNWMIDLLAAMGDESLKADVVKLKALVNKSTASMGDTGGFTAKITGSGSSFTGTMVFDVKDEAAFRQVMKDSAELAQTGIFKRLYNSFGMKADFTLKPEAAEYAGVKIDQARLTMEGMGDEQADKMIKAMYGDGFDYRFAVIKGKCLATFGDNSETGIKAMIDEAKAGKAKTIGSEAKAAMALLPGAEKMDFVATYNYVRALAVAGPAMLAVMPGTAAPKINVETKSNLVFAGTTGKGAAMVDIVVPKAHVLEIKTALEQMMQQMQLGQGNQPQTN